MRRHLVAPIALAALLFARPSGAAVVTGTLSPLYGAPRVVQTTQTTIDSPSGSSVNTALGDELDAGYAYVDNGVLHLFLSGNQSLWMQLEGGITHNDPLHVFIDTQPGGQGTLLSNNPTVDAGYDLAPLAGLTFDSGFGADYAFSLSCLNWPTLRAYSATLPPGGGGAGTFLGTTACGGPGTLSGGNNTAGVAVTLDDSNTGGVTQGCGAASGVGVTTGIEWAIPLAAIGNPASCIGVCVLFTQWNNPGTMINQVLSPLPPGTCALSPTGSVNFRTYPGNQYFAWCPGVVPARLPTWGGLKSRYR